MEQREFVNLSTRSTRQDKQNKILNNRCTNITMTAWLTLLLLSCLLKDVTSSAIGFSSSTSSIIPLMTSTLTLRCDLHDTTPPHLTHSQTDSSPDSSPDSHTNIRESQADSDPLTQRKKRSTHSTVNVDHVTSIVISKDGVDLATLTQHFPATSLVNSPDVHVTGSLTGQGGEKGYLEVTVDHPTENDSGLYKCEIDSFVSEGHSYDFFKTLEIMKEEITLKDLVSLVKEKVVEEMNQANAHMNQTDEVNPNNSQIIQTIRMMNQTIEKMTQDNAKMNEANAQMTQDNAKMSQTIEKMSQDNAKMNEANAQMTQDNAKMSQTIEKMTQDNTKINQNIEKMTQDNAKMNQTIEMMTLDNAKMNEANAQMTQDNAKMSQANAQMKATIRDQAKEILAIQQTYDNLSSQVNTSLTQVFFSAGLTAANDTSTVIYDKVWSNVGSAYDATTGVVTCTVAGYYRFVTSVVSKQDKSPVLELKHNNNPVYRVFSLHGKGYLSATNSAIIKLNKGDTVRVEYAWSWSNVYSFYSELVTSFSGQLISAV